MQICVLEKKIGPTKGWDSGMKMGMETIHWRGYGAGEKMSMRGMILLWGEGDPRKGIWKGGQVGKKVFLGS
jgi:hypothetical protein